MIHLAHHLSGRVSVPGPRIVVVDSVEGDWLHRDLRAELLDLFPGARIDAAPAETKALAPCDLAVVPLRSSPEFALDDVVYRSLRPLERLAPALRAARWVLVYRVRWREVEVVAGSALAKYLRRRRVERAAIATLRRWPLLRRVVGGT